MSGNRVLEDGQPIVMHGINYFGFNNAQTMVDGLWAGEGCTGIGRNELTEL